MTLARMTPDGIDGAADREVSCWLYGQEVRV
jgi:hypothetical protein